MQHIYCLRSIIYRVTLSWNVNRPRAGSHTVRTKMGCTALIAHVWHDRMINIGGFDQNGAPINATTVQLLQDDDPKAEEGFFCSWMPYQRSQAARRLGVPYTGCSRASRTPWWASATVR